MAADLERAKAKAAEILKEYHIVRPPINPHAIAKAEGAEVFYADFKEDMRDKISGFIRFNEENDNAPQIIVNRAMSPTSKIFTTAHELAHYLLHRDYAKSNAYQVMPRHNFYPGGKPKEEEADCFAAALLVPENMLKEYQPYMGLTKLAAIFTVSEDVILSRKKFLGI